MPWAEMAAVGMCRVGAVARHFGMDLRPPDGWTGRVEARRGEE
jgi:hypothetical protein